MGGYCTHSSILFPPWSVSHIRHVLNFVLIPSRHRPYLALFEQHLAKHVTDIANEFPADKRQRYQQAAQRFRIP
jgi:tyrosinase